MSDNDSVAVKDMPDGRRYVHGYRPGSRAVAICDDAEHGRHLRGDPDAETFARRPERGRAIVRAGGHFRVGIAPGESGAAGPVPMTPGGQPWIVAEPFPDGPDLDP